MPKQPDSNPTEPQDSTLRARLEPLRGQDPIVDQMLSQNLPLTREMWMSMNYLDPNPEDENWTSAHEADVPEPFQNPEYLSVEKG